MWACREPGSVRAMNTSAEARGPTTAELVCAALRHATASAPHGLRAERLPVGYGHENWRVFDTDGGRWLVKIAERMRSPLRMENAVAAQRLAAGGGVLVPEIVGFETGSDLLGRPYCVQRWVDGSDAGTALAKLAPAARRALGASLGVQVARMHTIESDWVGEGVLPSLRLPGWRPYAHAQTDRLRTLNLRHVSLDLPTLDAAAAGCHRLADVVDVGFRPGLAHRDLWPPNVILAADGTVAALLDFEHARFTDPAWDLVKLDLLFLRSHPDIDATFRAAYRGLRGWDGAFDVRIRLCFGLELLRGLPYFHAEFPNAGMAAMLESELRQWLDTRA